MNSLFLWLGNNNAPNDKKSTSSNPRIEITDEDTEWYNNTSKYANNDEILLLLIEIKVIQVMGDI